MATKPTANRKQLAREATETALMDAALRLLERDGVLAGLNLQEVADEAEVNRGLIHRYFGTRQALLRAALESRQERLSGAVTRSYERDPVSRGNWSVKQYAQDATYARIVLLLALDDDGEFEPIPFFSDRVAVIERETIEGAWPEGTDAVALTVLWDVLLNGYFTMRKPAARQARISLMELDARFFGLLDRLFSTHRGSGVSPP